MKLNKFIALLEKTKQDIIKSGGNVTKTDIAVEAIDDNGHIYYESSFGVYIDDNCDIGLSPKNK